MNLNIAVVGASRAGKTLFCINFAEYLGSRSLCYTESGAAGRGRGVLSPAAARKLMVNPGRHCNGIVRTFIVHLLQEPPRRIALIDTASLKEKNPLPRIERQKLLLTLHSLRNADIVLQLIDLSCSDPARLEFNYDAGLSLAEYCRMNGKLFYMAGSKADLAGSISTGRSCYAAPGCKALPISSVTLDGFARLQHLIVESAASDYIIPGKESTGPSREFPRLM